MRDFYSWVEWPWRLVMSMVSGGVLLLVSALWTRLGRVPPLLTGACLLVSFGLSVVLALVFYRWVEAPAVRVSRLVRG